MSTGAAAIYARKSKITGKGESIDNQIELCREYVHVSMGDDIKKIYVYTDEGFSGGNLERPGFRSMMKAAERGDLDAVIVYRLDRISRSIGDFSGLIEEMNHLGIKFVSIKEQFDTGTPMGRAMMYIASVFSQLERETIAERIRDNMQELAKTGRWLGGTTPTGYMSESVSIVGEDGRTHKASKLRVIPGEAETVKIIYRDFIRERSLTGTESGLMQKNILSRNSRYYTRFTIRSILQNPVYAKADADTYKYFKDRGAEICSPPEAFDGLRGILAYNRTDQKKGKTKVYMPVDRWIISVGQHSGIIDGGIWTEVQQLLERNSAGAYRQPRKNEALLTGMIFCQCGGRMYPRIHKTSGTYSYVCKVKERSRGSLCSGRNISGNVLDSEIIRAISEYGWDRKAFSDKLKKSRKNAFAGGEERQTDEKLMSDLVKRINNLTSALRDISDSGAKCSIEKRIGELKKEYSKAAEGGGCVIPGEERYREVLDSLCDFEGCIYSCDIGQRRRLTEALVGRAELHGDEMLVIMSGAGDLSE